MQKRNVQHYPITDRPVHVTYRLFGSVPKCKLDLLKTKYHLRLDELDLELQRNNSRPNVAATSARRRSIQAWYHNQVDILLHQIKSGPHHLKRAKIAQQVMSSWNFLQEQGRVKVCSLCIMSNHVHVVLDKPLGVKLVFLDTLMKNHKSFTGSKGNEILGRRDVPFWAPKYFDRTIRVDGFTPAMWYVLNNAVHAGLVERWEDWPYAYVHPDYADYFQSKHL